jgi:hypothetical protein
VLVVGLQALQDLVVAHEERLTRADLTVDAAIGAVGRIVRRTLDGKRPEQGALW